MILFAITLLIIPLFAGTPNKGSLSREASGKTLRINCGRSKILITSATYGGNCGASRNNQLVNLAKACNNRGTCNYRVNHGIIGDPVPNCAKTYNYEYICKGGSTLSKEASGKRLSIGCGAGDEIVITSATYGSNCGASKDNQLGNLAKACNYRATCSYQVNHRVIGDPAFGCAKTYTYDYVCIDASSTIPIYGPFELNPEHYMIYGVVTLVMINIICIAIFCCRNRAKDNDKNKYKVVSMELSENEDLM